MLVMKELAKISNSQNVCILSNIFYLVFSTSNNIIKKEKVTQFAVPIRQLHYKWILHKSTLSSISRLLKKKTKQTSQRCERICLDNLR